MGVNEKVVLCIICVASASVSTAAAVEQINQAILDNDNPKLAALLREDPRLVNQRNDLGETPLHVAAGDSFQERAQAAELLLRSGADVNARAKSSGETPLHGAAARGYKEVAALLIDFGADVNTRDARGRTPLNYAAAYNNREVAGLLLARGATLDASDAVALGKVGRLQELLERDPSLSNARGGVWDKPLLEIAAARRQRETANLLLAYGARVDIYLACALGRLDEVRRFLEVDPRLLSSDDRAGQTPLDWAVRGGQKEVAEFLLARGADINAGPEGFTPLCVAAEVGDKQMAKLLFTHGAGKDTRVKIRALQVAMARHHEEIANLLRNLN